MAHGETFLAPRLLTHPLHRDAGFKETAQGVPDRTSCKPATVLLLGRRVAAADDDEAPWSPIGVDKGREWQARPWGTPELIDGEKTVGYLSKEATRGWSWQASAPSARPGRQHGPGDRGSRPAAVVVSVAASTVARSTDATRLRATPDFTIQAMPLIAATPGTDAHLPCGLGRDPARARRRALHIHDPDGGSRSSGSQRLMIVLSHPVHLEMCTGGSCAHFGLRRPRRSPQSVEKISMIPRFFIGTLQLSRNCYVRLMTMRAANDAALHGSTCGTAGPGTPGPHMVRR